MAIQSTSKISAKGQITLPRAVRDVLGSDLVRIVVEGEVVRLEPVPVLAGRLKRFANQKVGEADVKDQAWSEAMHDKYRRD